MSSSARPRDGALEVRRIVSWCGRSTHWLRSSQSCKWCRCWIRAERTKPEKSGCITKPEVWMAIKL